MLFFERFNFTLIYRPGSRNIKPDARQLSPYECTGEPKTIMPSNRVVASPTWEIEDMVCCAQSQQPDPGKGPPIPQQWAHASHIFCHPGATRTLEVVKRFWWPSVDSDTWEFVKACPVCAHNKTSHQPSLGFVHPLLIPEQPWSHIAIDFASGLPLSQGHTMSLSWQWWTTCLSAFIPSAPTHLFLLSLFQWEFSCLPEVKYHMIKRYQTSPDFLQQQGHWVQTAWQWCRSAVLAPERSPMSPRSHQSTAIQRNTTTYILRKWKL